MIDFTKPVQTRDGRKVTILRTDLRSTFPVAGILHDDDAKLDSVFQWASDGSFSSKPATFPIDLIQAPTFRVGDKVVTRDGRKGRIICTDRDDLNNEPIVALIGCEPICYAADGRYMHDMESIDDISLA